MQLLLAAVDVEREPRWRDGAALQASESAQSKRMVQAVRTLLQQGVARAMHQWQSVTDAAALPPPTPLPLDGGVSVEVPDLVES